MTHHRHGAVRWDIVKGITIGILIGTFSGTWLAAQLSTRALKIFFALFSFFTAPFGARLAHKTPVVTLKRIYAVFLIIVATRILWGAL